MNPFAPPSDEERQKGKPWGWPRAVGRALAFLVIGGIALFGALVLLAVMLLAVFAFWPFETRSERFAVVVLCVMLAAYLWSKRPKR